MKDIFNEMEESPPRNETLSQILGWDEIRGWEYLQDVPVHDEMIPDTGINALNPHTDLILSGEVLAPLMQNFDEMGRPFHENEIEVIGHDDDDDDHDDDFPKDVRDFNYTEKTK